MGFKVVLLLLASGGVLTSLAEYKFQYNLVDLVVEKVKSIFGVAKKDVNEAASEVKKIL
jgi:hypothetical protein